ncbi:hypothetical protein c118 [Metallosphaera turreted icosahedral virus]|uniref:hypothetical protein c118 n=1 Tax=Metallosphaera turreted icosahedral virus TaxID=2023155 RepID=UPI000B8DA858|nr:hypothetical protein c118 [Metallosphaera turreted icosahedral virus]ASO67382.1 hypothetical protein c118 [Metallosphaera turreted icosahedral virus]
MSSNQSNPKKEVSLEEFFEAVKDEVIPLRMIAGDYVVLEGVHMENLRDGKNGKIVDVVGRIVVTNMGLPEGQKVRFTLGLSNAMEVAHHIKDGIKYTMIKKGEMRIVVNGFSEIPKRL